MQERPCNHSKLSPEYKLRSLKPKLALLNKHPKTTGQLDGTLYRNEKTEGLAWAFLMHLEPKMFCCSSDCVDMSAHDGIRLNITFHLQQLPQAFSVLRIFHWYQ